MSGRDPVKSLCIRALILAVALILSYVESLIPFHFAVPGVKIGLANIAVIFALYRLKPWEAGLISLLRVLIVSLLFGTFVTFLYAAAGAAVSFLSMLLLKKAFHVLSVSAVGAVLHNVAQIGVAVLLLGTGELVYYLPVLLLSGIVTGLLIGFLSAVLVKRIPKEIA